MKELIRALVFVVVACPIVILNQKAVGREVKQDVNGNPIFTKVEISNFAFLEKCAKENVSSTVIEKVDVAAFSRVQKKLLPLRRGPPAVPPPWSMLLSA